MADIKDRLMELLSGCSLDTDEDVQYVADKLIAADVAPVVRGRWIAVDGEEQPCDEWDCTACGQRRTFMCEMDADDMKEFYPYCPNCGARMDGE